jgi:hypothetical protein
MDAKKLNEKELSKYFFDEERFSQLGLKLLDKEVKIGAFKLDGVNVGQVAQLPDTGAQFIRRNVR